MTLAPALSSVDTMSEWPALSTSNINSNNDGIEEDDWKMTTHQDASSYRCFDKNNNRILHHSASSPNFPISETILEEDKKNGGILSESCLGYHQQQQPGEGSRCNSVASSSIVMASAPPSLMTESTPSGVSFRDIILKENEEESGNLTDRKSSIGAIDKEKQIQQQAPARNFKKKPKFVVTPIKRCARSTGDLRSLSLITEESCENESGGHGCGNDSDEHILGETDAELFYNQKAQGRLGRTNGRKIRLDEKKRLEMTMAKKNDQRQRQKSRMK